MKRRKKILVIAFLLCGIFSMFIQANDKTSKIIKNEKKERFLSSNSISMLYETEVGSGEYQTSTDTTWPSSGYIFNERLSKCENGGTLSWNEETKRVIMQTNTSDKCYVYFDKYKVPTINNVNVSKTYNSISLTVDATKGNNEIVKYYYSKDDGSSYVNSTSNSYTFSGLTSDATYNFKVYVVDTSGYSSNTKSISATTDKETNIEITNATGHAGENSIGVNSISINSINPIKMYYVKFSNLTNNAESNIVSFTEIPYIYYSYYDIILPCFYPSNNVIAELYAEDIYGNISNVYEFSLNTTGSWACLN